MFVSDYLGDTTPPTTTDDVASPYLGQAVISLTATDTGGSGVADTYYRLNGGAIATYTAPITVRAAELHPPVLVGRQRRERRDGPQRRFVIDTEIVRRGGRDRYAVAVDASRPTSPRQTRHPCHGLDVCRRAVGLRARGMPQGTDPRHAPGRLPANVEAEIQRLEAQKVTIVGGPNRSHPESSATQELGFEVERIGGNDRYVVSQLIASKVRAFGNDGGRIFIASGEVGADALP